MPSLDRVNPTIETNHNNTNTSKQGSCIFIALLWVLGLCICGSEMMQNWMYEISSDNEMQKLVIMKMNAANSKKFIARHKKQFNTTTTAAAVQICMNPVKKEFDFAIVTTIESKDEHEKKGAMALGKSIQAWNVEADQLLLLFVNDDTNNKTLNAYENDLGIESGIGWTICLLDVSSLPMDVRLRAWALTEYKAVVIMEKDTLIVGDISILFTLHYNAMLIKKQMENTSTFPLGAIDKRTTPCQIEENNKPFNYDISTGVLFIVPNFTEYLRLKKRALQGLSTDKPLNFRLLLRSHFEDPRLQYALPPEFNANIAWKYCNLHWWLHADIKILHFTIAKPWNYNDNNNKQVENVNSWNGFTTHLLNTHWNANHPWACWLTGSEELCNFWKECFEVKESKMACCWAAKYNYKKKAGQIFM